MSKVVLRLVVVILIIAGITSAIYFILNRPDQSKKIYNTFISNIEKENYKDFDYLTKKFTVEGKQTQCITSEGDLLYEYTLADVIKTQIENCQYLCAYAKNVDTNAQENVLKALKNYNEIAYGNDGISHQAKYYYNFKNKENDGVRPDTDRLEYKLIQSLMNMQREGVKVLEKLVPFVKNSVYQGTKIDEISFILYDLRASVASGEIAQLDEKNNISLEQRNKFNKYIEKLTQLINSGESDGFYLLNDSELKNVIFSYNSLERTYIIDMFKAEDTLDYIGKIEDKNIKKNLTYIYDYLEV